MLSISALGNLGQEASEAKAAAHYYESNDSYDYYVKDMESKDQGEWMGQGAGQMGILGNPVQGESLQLAFAGYLSGRQVQNAGKPNRQMGWDLTFSAPKSVSIAWAAASLEERIKIETAHRQAIKAAFRYLEGEVRTRLGQGGRRREKTELVAALFTHHTSRAGDPQLHSHLVVPNLCVGTLKKVRTIESIMFYELKMAAGALYRAELAYCMKQMGYRIEPGVKGTFRLRDVDPRLEEIFSKRDKQIEKVSQEKGIETYAGQRQMVLATRAAKVRTSFAERLRTWREEAKRNGLELFAPKSQELGGLSHDVAKCRTMSLQSRQVPAKDSQVKIETARLLSQSAQAITQERSVFKEKEILRELAQRTYGRRNAQGVLSLARSGERQGILVNLNRGETSQAIYSTLEMVRLEQEMARIAVSLAKPYSKPKENEGIEVRNFKVPLEKILAKYPYLTQEQKTAVEAAAGESAICVIQGRAGAGKTTALAALREAYESEGFKVQGIALSGQAARNLEQETGIPSLTITSWNLRGRLDCRTILILDEAGLVGSSTMTWLLNKVRLNFSKLILVGDERQLQPIEAGGALHAIDSALRESAPEYSSAIEAIKRQRQEWMRQVVTEAAKGKADKALDLLEAKGKIAFYEKAADARTLLVQTFMDREKNAGLGESLILTHRKSEARCINEEIRKRLQAAGLIKEDRLGIHNGERKLALAIGDRIVFTKNEYRRFDVRNGQGAVIEAVRVSGKEIEVKMDSGHIKTIALQKYPHVDYGWALTTHKAQGITLNRCYVFGYTNEPMASRQSTYVQISRSREETKLFVVSGEKTIERASEFNSCHTEDMAALRTKERGQALEEMKRLWGKDAAKGTTLDFGQEQEAQERRTKHTQSDFKETLPSNDPLRPGGIANVKGALAKKDALNEHQQFLFDRMMEEIGDKRYGRFWQEVSRRMSEGDIADALSLTREADRMGRITTTKARYFNGLIRKYAGEKGIALGFERAR